MGIWVRTYQKYGISRCHMSSLFQLKIILRSTSTLTHQLWLDPHHVPTPKKTTNSGTKVTFLQFQLDFFLMLGLSKWMCLAFWGIGGLAQPLPKEIRMNKSAWRISSLRINTLVLKPELPQMIDVYCVLRIIYHTIHGTGIFTVPTFG